MTSWQIVRLVGGTFILLSLALGIPGSPLFVSQWWLAFTAFVGVNLLRKGYQSASRGAVPAPPPGARKQRKTDQRDRRSRQTNDPALTRWCFARNTSCAKLAARHLAEALLKDAMRRTSSSRQTGRPDSERSSPWR